MLTRKLAAVIVALIVGLVPLAAMRPATASVDPIAVSIRRYAGTCYVQIGFSQYYPQTGYIQALNGNCALMSVLVMTYDCRYVSSTSQISNPYSGYVRYASLPVGKEAAIISWYARGKDGGVALGNLYR